MESDSDTNLSLGNFLLMSSHWVMTKVVGQSNGKKFSDLKFAAEKLASFPLTVWFVYRKQSKTELWKGLHGKDLATIFMMEYIVVASWYKDDKIGNVSMQYTECRQYNIVLAVPLIKLKVTISICSLIISLKLKCNWRYCGFCEQFKINKKGAVHTHSFYSIFTKEMYT